jgi:hypothetical protein
MRRPDFRLVRNDGSAQWVVVIANRIHAESDHLDRSATESENYIVVAIHERFEHFTSANQVSYPKELSILKPSSGLTVNGTLRVEARTTRCIQRRRSSSICLVGLSASCMLRRS